MANKTIAVHLPQDSGNTSLTLRLRAGGTIINTPDTLTETGSTGYFTCTVTEANSAGWHSVDILSGATVRYAGGWVYLPSDTEGTYVVDSPESIGGGGGGLDAAGVRAAIGLASANLDTQLADLPTVSEFNARTLVAADYFVVGDYTAPTNLSAAQVRSELATELARIDVAITTRAVPTDVQLLAVQNISPTLERVNGDTDAIRFTWPVDAATITGEVSKNGGSYAEVQGGITQRTTEAGVYWYQLAYDADDRMLGSNRYKFTDGTRTRFVNLLVNPATATVDLNPVLDKLPESGRATTAPQVRTELSTELARVDATVSSRSTLTASDVWSHATRSLTTFGTLVSDIWTAGTRTLTAISDSSGITTLLSRIAGTIRTSADDVSAETAQTAAVRSGLALEATVDAAETAILAAIDGIEGGGGGTVGPGSIERTLTIKLGSQVIDGAAVWVSTDSAGNNVIAGTLYSDGNGLVTFMLDAGTYYAWCQKNGVNFTNPTAFQVTAP